LPGPGVRPSADDTAELRNMRLSYRRSRCRVEDDGGEYGSRSSSSPLPRSISITLASSPPALSAFGINRNVLVRSSSSHRTSTMLPLLLKVKTIGRRDWPPLPRDRVEVNSSSSSSGIICEYCINKLYCSGTKPDGPPFGCGPSDDNNRMLSRCCCLSPSSS